jgi:hypothetical protein
VKNNFFPLDKINKKYNNDINLAQNAQENSSLQGGKNMTVIVVIKN